MEVLRHRKLQVFVFDIMLLRCSSSVFFNFIWFPACLVSQLIFLFVFLFVFDIMLQLFLDFCDFQPDLWANRYFYLYLASCCNYSLISSLTCEPIDYSNDPEAIRALNLAWIFYISKVKLFIFVFYLLHLQVHWLRRLDLLCAEEEVHPPLLPPRLPPWHHAFWDMVGAKVGNIIFIIITAITSIIIHGINIHHGIMPFETCTWTFILN